MREEIVTTGRPSRSSQDSDADLVAGALRGDAMAFEAAVRANGWVPVPPRALANFPAIDDIMAKGVVRHDGS